MWNLRSASRIHPPRHARNRPRHGCACLRMWHALSTRLRVSHTADGHFICSQISHGIHPIFHSVGVLEPPLQIPHDACSPSVHISSMLHIMQRGVSSVLSSPATCCRGVRASSSPRPLCITPRAPRCWCRLSNLMMISTFTVCSALSKPGRCSCYR